jgi:selenium metabolism protein YedF
VTILITNRYFGQGEEELGQVLMRSFLYTLGEMNGRVKSIIFMNSGVFLTTEGSEVLEILQGLSQEGVQILSCGTCLDFYGIKDKLAVGEITNMYTAVEMLSSAERSITL